jgi:CRISPR/Cas system CSM-associated protein Csm3 (group 7 of RAMP superfamily)
MALAAKRGEIPASQLRGAAREMYETMDERQLEDYAATPLEGLPEHVPHGHG